MISVMVKSLALTLLLCACPHLPPPSGCTPFTQHCTAAGLPEVCSATQRWQPAGDSPCSGVCAVSDAGVAHCALAVGVTRVVTR